MPKSTQSAAALKSNSDAPASEAATLCARADALFRAACECCRQHERVARLVSRTDDAAEHRAAYALVEQCDRTLEEMAAAYEKATARQHPNGDDEAWWRKANALWHASREYARRHRQSDQAARQCATSRDPMSLATLNIDYELEASALLALKQALDAYRKVRPHADC